MGRPATDWDVTTSASPEAIASVFKSLRSFSLKHETVTLVHKGSHYEVTTFRGPKQTLEDDLGHRDFTINAMAYDLLRSLVIDPWGGRKDLAKKAVKGVVSPEKRFREDPLRLLRAVRFAAELGFRIESRTLKAISSMAETITIAAHERIRDELVKALVSEKPSQGLHLLSETGLLRQILPELSDMEKMKWKVVDLAPADPAQRLSALFCAPARLTSSEIDIQSAITAQSVMTRLCFSKSMIRQVVRLVEEERALAGYDSSWKDADLRRLIRRVGTENWETLVGLRRANLTSLTKKKEEPLRLLKEVHARIEGLIKTPLVRGPQDLAINGSDVMKITGLSRGPEVGRILRRLSEVLLDHPEWNKRERLESIVKEMKPAVLSDHPKALVERHRTAGRLKARSQAEP
jgi:tRNA nucleotidyltransferase/poly(A) polymerase